MTEQPVLTPWSRRRWMRPVLAATVLSGTLGAALMAGSPAGADTSAGTVQLGGYNLISSASGASVFYEQPNFPIPATPTLEFNLGYSTSTFDSGPIATANASTLWPGPVVAGGGSQLPLLLDPYLEQYFAPLAPTVEPLIPTSLPYPFQASSAYPQGPPTATNNNGPLSMNSSSSATAAQSNAALAMVGGSASQSSLPAGLLSIEAVGSSTSNTIDATGRAVSQATSTVHGIDMADGILQIGAVTSSATSTSDGNQANLTGSSTATGVSIAGQSVSIDANGLHVMGTTQNLLGAVVPNVNTVLATAGISLSLTNPTDTVLGASGERQLDGLAVTINLATYDQNLSKLVAMLPSQLANELNTLPLALPYKQSITFDFAWVNVNADASPSFSFDLGSDLGLGAAAPVASSGGDVSSLPTSFGGTPGTTSSVTPASPTSPSGVAPATLSAAPVALFKGIGAGLLLLGLLLTALLVFLLLRADRAVGSLATGTPCIGENLGDGN